MQSHTVRNIEELRGYKPETRHTVRSIPVPQRFVSQLRSHKASLELKSGELKVEHYGERFSALYETVAFLISSRLEVPVGVLLHY